MTFAQMLKLPEGWVATRFPSTVELELRKPAGIIVLQTGIPVPYNPMTEDEWIKAAADAIAKVIKPT